MHAFLRGDADVLVSTTIIESGLDIPQANTLIVERADVLGLAQLYQIRGRVGRSDVAAHAYLFYPEAAELTRRGAGAPRDARRPHRARRRLRDRDARPRDPRRRRPARRRAVGPRRRARLRAVRRAARTRRSPSSPASGASPCARCASTPASTRTSRPTYIGAEALKIDLHRRLALAESEDELRELRAATEDRYGPLPEPVENLFAIQEAKLQARPDRRRLPRLPRRQGDGRPLVLGSGRAARAPRRCSTRRSTRRQAARCRSGPNGSREPLELADAILALAPGQLKLLHSAPDSPHETPPPTPDRRSLALAPRRRAAAAAAARRSVPSDAVAVVDGQPITKAQLDALLDAGEGDLQDARSARSRRPARPSTRRCRRRRSRSSSSAPSSRRRPTSWGSRSPTRRSRTGSPRSRSSTSAASRGEVPRSSSSSRASPTRRSATTSARSSSPRRSSTR